MRKIGLVLALVLALFSISIVVAQDAAQGAVDRTGWPETFIIGVYTGGNVDAALAANQPLADYLTQALGVPTLIITGNSYAAVVEAMRTGRADAFEADPFSYLLAANAEALAVSVYRQGIPLDEAQNVQADVIPGYYSLIFTKKGSGITNLDDLAGHTFVFTDPTSISGYLIPAALIMQSQGFTDPAQLDTFFSAPATYAGNHPAVARAVQSGSADAGASFDDSLAAQADSGQIALCDYTLRASDYPFRHAMTQGELDAIYDDCHVGEMAVIAQSPLIPQSPFAINAALPQSFKDAVRAALLDIVHDPDVIVAIGRYYVDPTAALGLETLDAYYDPLRDAVRLLHLDLSARSVSLAHSPRISANAWSMLSDWPSSTA